MWNSLSGDMREDAEGQGLNDLQGTVETLRTRAGNIEENVALVNDDLNSLRQDIQLKATKAEINNLFQDLGQLRGVDSLILSNLTFSWQELNQVRNQISDLENDDLDIDERLTQLQLRTEDLNRELGRLSQGATDLERTVSEMRFAEQQVEPVNSPPASPPAPASLTSRLVQNVTVMSSRLDQLRNDVIYLQGQSLSQGADLIQLHQDFREFIINNTNALQRPALTELNNQTLIQIQNSGSSSVNKTLITLLFTSLQQLQQDNNFLYQNLTGLHRQFTGVRTDFADVVDNVNQFQSDLDELQWNNAQLYYDVVDLQEVKDVVNTDITTLRRDLRRVLDQLGMLS